MGRSQLWFARIIRLTGLALTIVSLASVVPLLIIISYPGPEPYWNAYFQAVPIGITILLMLLMLPGTLLCLVGSAISPPDPRLDFWLDMGRFRKYLRLGVETKPPEAGVISASFAVDRPYGLAWTLGERGKCFVEFDEGHLFLGQPGKDVVLIEAKTIQRLANFAIQFDTGRFNYGKVTLFFDSVEDTDRVEEEAKRLLKQPA